MDYYKDVSNGLLLSTKQIAWLTLLRCDEKVKATIINKFNPFITNDEYTCHMVNICLKAYNPKTTPVLGGWKKAQFVILRM